MSITFPDGDVEYRPPIGSSHSVLLSDFEQREELGIQVREREVEMLRLKFVLPTVRGMENQEELEPVPYLLAYQSSGGLLEGREGELLGEGHYYWFCSRRHCRYFRQ
jgi:hypothetical protein